MALRFEQRPVHAEKHLVRFDRVALLHKHLRDPAADLRRYVNLCGLYRAGSL